MVDAPKPVHAVIGVTHENPDEVPNTGSLVSALDTAHNGSGLVSVSTSVVDWLPNIERLESLSDFIAPKEMP